MDDVEEPGPSEPRNYRGRMSQRGRSLHLRRLPLQGRADQTAFRGPPQNYRPAEGSEARRRRFNRETTPVRENSSIDEQRNFPRKQWIGFKKLEEIAKSDVKETLGKLMENRKAFLELIQSPVDKYDIFVVILEIIAKVCQSSFDATKSRMLSDICNSNFIVSFKSYLMELPYVQSKITNNLYWKDQDSQLAFWRNFVDFCECVINTSPTLAQNKCRSLLEATSKACLDGLKERHNFELPEEYGNKLVNLRKMMADFEKNNIECTSSKRAKVDDNSPPPENFRELSIMPTRVDLLHQKPFVRSNKVDGAYEDVEHYLDVQFRLLREDCFGPLRVGLNQYMQDQQKKRYDNIRVFRDVKFVKPYVSQTKIGSLVRIDVRHNKMFRKTNWSNNKRFIFGSLVLFTKDNCKSFITATILDREEEYLVQGLIPVSIIGQSFNVQLYNDDVYTMIESEVYYEPYFHVLKVLQDPSFPQHLAMQQYIVHVNPQPQYPSYLTEDTKFTIDRNNKMLPLEGLNDIDLLELLDHKRDKVKFIVRNQETWPKIDELSFNESQYDAYKLALTHEFALIQGPPGTGKTYLGIKVAKALFENLHSTADCLMLVICYTNHALDQFLEALLDITKYIVRIGGQSRNEAMEKINLNKLRYEVSTSRPARKAFFEEKISLQESTSAFQKALVKLDVLLNGVVKSNLINNLNEVKILCDYYGQRIGDRDPLYYWLFEHSEQ